MKVCKKCGIEKELNEFYKDNRINGYRSVCKNCISVYQKNINKIHRREIVKKSYYKNIDKSNKYYQDNKEKIKSRRNKHHEENRDIENEKSKAYGKINRKKLSIYNKKYSKKRTKIDPLYKLTKNIRSLIKLSFYLKGYRKSKTNEILGCSFKEFKIYLESKFESWMNWNNHGKFTGNYSETWQLDHIIPVSFGNSEEDIIKLNHYTNLQPLCSKKNLEKSNKLI